MSAKKDVFECQIHYGEYSLKYWIELILKGDVVLPEYQRSFAWKIHQVREMISNMQKRLFVPPVIIGVCQEADGSKKNLIIDGQQRLTAILLSYLNIYPNKSVFKSTDVSDEDKNDTMQWTFRKLCSLGYNKPVILSKVGAMGKNKEYSSLALDDTNDNFFENTYLGFSYIVPINADAATQQQYYTSLFRSINAQGTPLTSQESRRALYYYNYKYVEWFDPLFIRNLRYAKNIQLDFVKYISILSQYVSNGKATPSLTAGFDNNLEKYYERYIDVITKESGVKDEIFGDFKTIIKKGNFTMPLKHLEEAVDQLDLQQEDLLSIITKDLYFFGLVYNIVFENRKLKSAEMSQLKQKIADTIANYHENDKEQFHSPSSKTHLRTRIADSLRIFKSYTTKI